MKAGYTTSVDYMHDDKYDDSHGDADSGYNINLINKNTPSTNSSYHHDHDSSYSVEEWEYTLGRLVIGYEVETDLGRRLSADPAISVYRRLVSSFRASMLIRALPFTFRLLMLSSIDYEELLSSFWNDNTPALFTTDEALTFLKYLEGLDLDIPYIKDIITLEMAMLICKIEDNGRREEVSFNYDPTILLNSLIQRRMPTNINKGRFNVEVTSDGLRCTKISDSVTRETNKSGYVGR